MERSDLYPKYVEEMNDDKPHILVATDSVLGTRKQQEDSVNYCVIDHRCLTVLCDGMGGLNAGEVASTHAVKYMMDAYMNCESISDYPEFFYDRAVEIDKEVNQLTDANGLRLKAGTTMVAVAIEGNALYWLSAGDSHIYIIRDNSVYLVNEEHNYKTRLDRMLQSGQITQDVYQSELKNGAALTSYIGIGDIYLLDINDAPYMLRDGDMIVLCSDGLYRNVTETMLLEILQEYRPDVKMAAMKLTEKATELSSGSQDNTTVAVMLYKE